MWRAEAIVAKDIPIGNNGYIIAGSKVNITKGSAFEYCVWHHSGLWDTPKEFIIEKSIKVIENDRDVFIN